VKTLLIGLAALGVTVALVSLPSLSQQERSGREMCEEVQIELELSVEAGLTDQYNAERVAERCFDLFAND